MSFPLLSKELCHCTSGQFRWDMVNLMRGVLEDLVNNFRVPTEPKAVLT